MKEGIVESELRPNPPAYIAGMDASTIMKSEMCEPHIKEGLIVDYGCGAGLLTVMTARNHPRSQVVGVELLGYLAKESHARVQEAGITNCAILQRDMCAPIFRPGSVDTVIVCSVGHHLYTYSGYDDATLRAFLKKAYDELKPGGRLILYDGLKPPHFSAALRILPSSGSRDVMGNPEDLSVEAMLLRFVMDFPEQVPLRPTSVNGVPVYCMASEHAYEFGMKKDFRANWPVEVKEVFGYWTREQFSRAFHEAGFDKVTATPFVNSWIVDNRIKPALEFYYYSPNGHFYRRPFPYTHVVIVAEK